MKLPFLRFYLVLAASVASTLTACSGTAPISPSFPHVNSSQPGTAGTSNLARVTASTDIYTPDDDVYTDLHEPFNFPTGGTSGGSGCGVNVCPQMKVMPHGSAPTKRATNAASPNAVSRSDSSNQRRPMFFVATTCWFLAVTPGVHNPQSDYPLGCEGYDIMPPQIAQVGPGGLGYHGPPIDGQTCSGSLANGDYLGIHYNADGTTTESTVAYSNGVVALKSAAIVNSAQGSYSAATVTVGWQYKDQFGGFWFQWNSAVAPDLKLSFSSWGVSIGVPLNTHVPMPTAGGHAPQLPSGQRYVSCWGAQYRMGG